ncbi:unnamed protein product [Pedinophyceae sp. YPF-701]|nr:unnamed protein product [Pedinophyceae sp. YPF-701]
MTGRDQDAVGPPSAAGADPGAGPRSQAGAEPSPAAATPARPVEASPTKPHRHRPLKHAQILVLGQEGAGKTHMVRQVVHYAEPKRFPEQTQGPHSTIGVEKRVCKLKGGVQAMFTEVGGCMKEIWDDYYAESSAVIYVVDAAATDEELKADARNLLELLDAPALDLKPVMVALTAWDRVEDSLTRMKQVTRKLRLPSLYDKCEGMRGRLTVTQISAATAWQLDQVATWVFQAAKIGVDTSAVPEPKPPNGCLKRRAKVAVVSK